MKKKKGIQAECGVTDISLANVRRLILEWGKPSLIVLTRPSTEYITTIYWGTAKKSFVCTGFAWGYGGEGPNGLLILLRELGLITKSITDIVRISKLPFVFEI